MSRPSAAALVILLAALAALGALGCSANAGASDAGPRTCLRDFDCGDHHYCSEGSVCRTDCFVDLDCLGPTKTAQCNAQGRCIETDLDAMAPDTAVAAPSDTGAE